MEQSIRMEGWPQVELEFVKPATEQEAQQWLADMDALLEKKQPFAMLIHARPNSHFSPESRKAMGLWFKEQRANLGQYCRGVARLVDSVEHGERVVSERMKSAMSFPMVATTDVEQATQWLAEKLRD